MGNQAISLGDEPSGGAMDFNKSSSIADKNLQHFDHNYKGELHSTAGSILTNVFGDCKDAKRAVEIITKGAALEIVENQGVSSRKRMEINYTQISAVGWDHGSSEVKFNLSGGVDNEETFIILTLADTIEFEAEMKLRFTGFSAISRDFRIPTAMYMGMFAGATKPKPFQRKRPNQSNLPAGKLPSLHDMRSIAIKLHKGSYKPCPPGESRRLDLAMQHIYEGQNSFSLLVIRGVSGSGNQWRHESVVVIGDESLSLKPYGLHSNQSVEFAFEDIKDWSAIDNESDHKYDSGIEIMSNTGEVVFFGVIHVRDIKHTLEYFWNRFCQNAGRPIKLGTTHGRPIISVTTLSGETAPGELTIGSIDVVDQDGMVVRPGGRIAQRRGSIMSTTKEPTVVPTENKDIKKHWHKVVAHQGWLLKKGGIGIGSSKSWIKRYFVLYKTSQGHFLVYYSDFTECPMYTSDKNHRNIVDLAKTTLLRPGSNKSDASDTPPHSFDIVTTEREWTLCAETQENAVKWLKLLNQAVDEDVAILPDEDLIFHVKPKVDPIGALPKTDYSTVLKVSANGVVVAAPDLTVNGEEREHFLWVYTDFYKWSLLSQMGKIALLVNVFADSSFSRRNEYIFRSKEAVRLATAIEYFIEKFMSVMHVRLELLEDVPVVPSETGKTQTGFHMVSNEEIYQQQQVDNDIDLLGMNITDISNDMPSYAPPPPSAGSTSASVFSDDPFGDDPFGEPSTPKTAPPPKPYVHVPVAPPPVPVADFFSGSNNDPFGNDLFGDSFGAPPPALPPKPAGPKLAPALTGAQSIQHANWYLSAIQNSGGLIYNDGTLQIACKVEVRGSQARVTLSHQNQSPASLSEFKLEIVDIAGLLRHELIAIPTTMAGLSQTQQQLMVECMKPAAPGPQLKISYVDSLLGLHSNTINLPVTLFSFNEPIALNANDFASRWQQLTTPGLEGQEIFKASAPIVPAQINAALTNILKCSKVVGLPDSSDFIIYGASSLRTGSLSPAGEKISIGCLLKIEMNVQTGSIRMTTRTLHPAATTASLQTAKVFLS